MGYFQVRHDSRVINYDCRGFIRLAKEIMKAFIYYPYIILANLAHSCDIFMSLGWFYRHFDNSSFSKQFNNIHDQCDKKKSPNVYKSCLKMISLEK